jgi:hypothetical protein
MMILAGGRTDGAQGAGKHCDLAFANPGSSDMQCIPALLENHRTDRMAFHTFSFTGGM